MAADKSLASLSENTNGIRPPKRKLGLLARLWRFFAKPNRKLSADEKRERNAKKLDKARVKGKQYELAAEADIWAAAIPDKLAQLGICYKYRKNESSAWVRYKKVELRRPYVLTEAALYFEVDCRPGHLPPDIGIERLEDPNVLRNLSTVIGHPVTCRAPSDGGFWYIVEREYGVRGIPRHVDYNEMLLGRPAEQSGLMLPIGIGENKRAAWRDLAQMPHMLVAGSTMSGKSNALNAFLCTLLRFNSPRRLRLVLVDLKGGIEFGRYDGVPHIWKISHRDRPDEQAIIDDREKVIPWLRRVMHLGEERMKVLREEKVKHIGEYNQRHPNKPWSYVVVIIDEWADILQDKLLRDDAGELLMNMVARLRAVGVHAIVCTQVPTAEVVSTRLKTNLQAKLALSVGTLQGSMAILGNGNAVGLEPQGRGIFDWGKKPITIQMPRVTEDTITQVVRQAQAGKFDEVELAENDMTDQEIFEWAVNENGGNLDVDSIFARFRYRRVTMEWALGFCQRVEGEQVVVGSTVYEVMAPAGRRPRRLLPVPDATPAAAEQAADGAPELDPLEPPALEATAAAASPMESTSAEQLPEPGPQPEPVTHQQIWEWAVRENGGSLAAAKVYAHFKPRGLSKRLAEAMSKTEPPLPIFVDGVEYAVLPPVSMPGGGGLPWRLEPVSQDGSPGSPPGLDGEDGNPESPGFPGE